MHLTLLHCHAGSCTHQVEALNRQLVQTALQQELCDIALVQGCTDVQEPLSAGIGAILFQAGCALIPPLINGDGDSMDQSGVMLCYKADKFEARQLTRNADHLPGWEYKAVQLLDICTGNQLIALTACTSTRLAAPCRMSAAKLLTPFHRLMEQLSTICPVIAAGEMTLHQDADINMSSINQHMQILQLPPVQITATTNSHSFFAALCPSTGQEVTFSNVQTILAGPSEVPSHTHIVYTVRCTLQHVVNESTPAKVDSLSEQNNIQPLLNATRQHLVQTAGTGRAVTASARLRSLFTACEVCSQSALFGNDSAHMGTL